MKHEIKLVCDNEEVALPVFWSDEACADLKLFHGIQAEEQMVDFMAKEIAKVLPAATKQLLTKLIN